MNIPESKNTYLDDLNLELMDTKVRCLRFSPRTTFKKTILGFILPSLYSTNFFSMTQDENEFSIIVDEETANTLETITSCSFVCFSKETFYVLKIYDETEKINETGIVANISNIFMQHNIPILFINSFSQNFVLIPENKIDLCKLIRNPLFTS